MQRDIGEVRKNDEPQPLRHSGNLSSSGRFRTIQKMNALGRAPGGALSQWISLLQVIVIMLWKSTMNLTFVPDHSFTWAGPSASCHQSRGLPILSSLS